VATIDSPYPGTFYRRPNPQADPYATEGDAVAPGSVIGLVEIMKNFHEVTSESAGTIVRFLAQDEDLVEAGQPLAEISD
jgi:biotin carboxyl carrier protein